jgi:protein-tyrosine phosphatase
VVDTRPVGRLRRTTPTGTGRASRHEPAHTVESRESSGQTGQLRSEGGASVHQVGRGTGGGGDGGDRVEVHATIVLRREAARRAGARVVASAAPSPAVKEGNLRDNGRMSFERMFDETALFRLCFVCTGNICRSPMAEVVFRDRVKKAGMEDKIGVMSAGTGDWHVGERSDERTLTSLADRGYDGAHHRAKQFDPDWFAELDLVVVFDHSQERILKAWASTEHDRSKVQLLLSFDKDQSAQLDVPDPYYSDAAFFDRVLLMIEHASSALFDQIKPGIQGVK